MIDCFSLNGLGLGLEEYLLLRIGFKDQLLTVFLQRVLMQENLIISCCNPPRPILLVLKL